MPDRYHGAEQRGAAQGDPGDPQTSARSGPSANVGTLGPLAAAQCAGETDTPAQVLGLSVPR